MTLLDIYSPFRIWHKNLTYKSNVFKNIQKYIIFKQYLKNRIHLQFNLLYLREIFTFDPNKPC